MPETTRYLSSHVIDTLRREIHEAAGAEIFAILSKNEGDDYFSNVAVTCRGTETQVPALLSRTKPGDMTLHNHPSGVLQPSQQDMAVATMFGEEGVGSMIVNNDVSHCIVITEPSTEAIPVDVDEKEVAAIFADDGPLARSLDNYERRDGQTAMAEAVTRGLNGNRILAVEAGTGTGKSLAYLIPSLLWTKHNKGRVVIATKTIALQEQLVFKDIPLARHVVPDAPRASLVKGRNNYVCLRKLHDMKSTQMALFTEEETDVKREIENLAGWVEASGSGDRADLPYVPNREAWEMVRSDSDMCMGAKCPFFQKSPFYESRRQAAQSKILVVNQALLFSDLALRSASGDYKGSAVIPPYEHVILDEAHSIEDIATDHFGEKISSLGLRMTLGRFLATRSRKGLLSRLTQAAAEFQAYDLSKALEEHLIPEFRSLQEQVVGHIHALSATLHETFNRDGKRQQVLWLKDDLLNSGVLNPAREDAKDLLGFVHELLLVVRKIKARANDQSEKFLEKTNGILIELGARLSRLEQNATALKRFAIKPGDNEVPWLALKQSRQYNEFEYKVSPLDVSHMLREALFKPFRSITMTSATLDLNDEFAFLSSRNGLRDWKEKEWQFDSFTSPFDYGIQARLFLARMPSEPHHSAYLHDLSDLVLRVALSGYPGGTLVLFTSYQLLYAVASRVEHPLARAGMDLLVQGRAARSFLLEHLKKSRGVLLGTDSFWEGVDLPGDAVTKVIITKLPFRQMGDPIFEARCAAIEADGRSSFKELSLPLALLKFKQGAGRLIRHKNDRGVLIVADNRIRTKGYGRRFLSLIDTYPFWELSPEEVSRALQSPEVTA